MSFNDHTLVLVGKLINQRDKLIDMRNKYVFIRNRISTCISDSVVHTPHPQSKIQKIWCEVISVCQSVPTPQRLEWSWRASEGLGWPQTFRRSSRGQRDPQESLEVLSWSRCHVLGNFQILIADLDSLQKSMIAKCVSFFYLMEAPKLGQVRTYLHFVTLTLDLTVF